MENCKCSVGDETIRTHSGPVRPPYAELIADFGGLTLLMYCANFLAMLLKAYGDWNEEKNDGIS